MHDDRSLLVKDLEEKWQYLFSIHDRPAFFVSEHFYEIRNGIDYDAERALQKLQEIQGKKNELNSTKINNLRDKLIRVLADIEKNLLNKLLDYTARSREAITCLKIKIDEFTSTAANSSRDINELEDAYTLLALETIDETQKLEADLLGNQTIAYIPSSVEDQIGHLVYLIGHFLNRDEISSLK